MVENSPMLNMDSPDKCQHTASSDWRVKSHLRKSTALLKCVPLSGRASLIDVRQNMLNPYRYLTIFGLIALCAIVFAGEQAQHASWAEDYGAVPSLIIPAFRELKSGREHHSLRL